MHANLKQLISSPSLDADYRFGVPKNYLTPHELARLTILRSRLGETRVERAAEQVKSATPSRRGSGRAERG